MSCSCVSSLGVRAPDMVSRWLPVMDSRESEKNMLQEHLKVEHVGSPSNLCSMPVCVCSCGVGSCKMQMLCLAIIVS